MGAFFPSDSHPMIYFIIWGMHGFPINFSYYGKMQQNSSSGENQGNWWSYFSHIMGAFFPLAAHFMVHLITREMDVFSHKFLITWENTAKTSEWGKFGKLGPGNILQNPLYVENLVNWYSYFSHGMGAFFPLDSYSMIYFIICEIHGFPLQFPIAWENAAKSIELGEPMKLVPIFPLTNGYSSSIRFPFYGIFCYYRGNAWFFPSKFTLRALWLFFHSITFSACSKIY